jgi:hypothetical protein
MRRLVLILTALLLAGFSYASAQSLAELAEKEKQRRGKLEAKEFKAFDDASLRSAGTVSSNVATQASGESEGVEPEEDEEAESDIQTEAYWQSRLETIDKRIAEIEARLNAPGFAENPSNLIRRQRYQQDLTEARAKRQEIVEDARRKGIPPGWLR